MQANKMFIKDIKSKGIDYFSLTLFRNKQTTLSYCNNNLWLEKYNKNYILSNGEVPVQKYILESSSKVIVWDSCTIDGAAREYINDRNKIVGVTTNVSVLVKKKEELAVITLGTKKNISHLLNFIALNKEFTEFEKDLLVYL